VFVLRFIGNLSTVYFLFVDYFVERNSSWSRRWLCSVPFNVCTCTDFISGCRVLWSWTNSTTISNLAIQEIITSRTEDFLKDETDYWVCHNVEKNKAPSYQKNLLSSRNDHENQDSNIMDPLLAHEL